jgi:hypothetical protein
MADMKPRHAAALAIVGWYLMAPPPQDLHAPISKWVMKGSYDTADACFADRALIGGNADLRAIQRRKAGLTAPDDPDSAALCIASDDPRLKEK